MGNQQGLEEGTKLQGAEGTKSQGAEKHHLANRAPDVILVNGELFYLQKSSMTNLDNVARHAQAAHHRVTRAHHGQHFEKQELTMDNIFSHDHGHDDDYDDLANSQWTLNGQLHDNNSETKSFDRRETVCETPLELYARLRGPSFDDVLHDDNHFSGWYFDHRVDTACKSMSKLYDVPLDDNDSKAWIIHDVVDVTTTYHLNGNYTSYILHVRLVSLDNTSTMEFDVEARHSEFLVAHEAVIQVIQSIRERMGEERMELLNTDEPLPPPKHWYGSNGETVIGRRLREWAALPLNTVRQLPKLVKTRWITNDVVVMTPEEEIDDERKWNQLGLKYLKEINKLWANEVSCEWIKFFLEHKKEE